MADQKKDQSFTKVEQLRPLADGLHLTLKVISAKTVVPRSNQYRQMRMTECLVGDETGIIVCTARDSQVDKMKEGNTVILHNAKVDMFKGSMRLAVDRSGSIEVAKDNVDFSVKENNNLSLIEFERIDVIV